PAGWGAEGGEVWAWEVGAWAWGWEWEGVAWGVVAWVVVAWAAADSRGGSIATSARPQSTTPSPGWTATIRPTISTIAASTGSPMPLRPSSTRSIPSPAAAPGRNKYMPEAPATRAAEFEVPLPTASATAHARPNCLCAAARHLRVAN